MGSPGMSTFPGRLRGRMVAIDPKALQTMRSAKGETAKDHLRHGVCVCVFFFFYSCFFSLTDCQFLRLGLRHVLVPKLFQLFS